MSHVRLSESIPRRSDVEEDPYTNFLLPWPDSGGISGENPQAPTEASADWILFEGVLLQAAPV